MGHALMTGTPINTVAHNFRVDQRTLEAGIERFLETGTMMPPAPTGGRGQKRPATRVTTPQQDAWIKASIPKKRGGPLEYTADIVKADLAKKGAPTDASNRSISRRFNEFGFGRDDHPAEKEPYSDEHMELREKYAKKHEHMTAAQWEKVVFTDEHDIIHASPATASRQVHSRKRWGWKWFEGGLSHVRVAKGIKKKNRFCPKDRYHRDAVRPKKTGGNVQGGTHVKLAVGVVGDTLLLCEPVQTYIDRRGPTQRPPQRLSKNGKPLGRKRKNPNAPPKNKKFDGDAYALFLEDLCGKARSVLNTRAVQPIKLLQDGFGAHWTPKCREAMRKFNVEPLEGYPARSPGCNGAENLFGTATPKLDKEKILNRPKKVKDTVERFRQICNGIAAEGGLSKTARSMPARMQRIIAARGGPTKD